MGAAVAFKANSVDVPSPAARAHQSMGWCAALSTRDTACSTSSSVMTISVAEETSFELLQLPPHLLSLVASGLRLSERCPLISC